MIDNYATIYNSGLIQLKLEYHFGVAGGGYHVIIIFTMKIQLRHSYNDVICLDNLISAWQEFIIGKRNKFDVQIFSRRLIDNIVSLHSDLAQKNYRHGLYQDFYIQDPKKRHIHKAQIRDRLLHHAVYRLLYPFFDKTFISHSYSCRKNKGLHKALDKFQELGYQASKNNTKTCWILKGDIEKFFASVDHEILLNILEQYIPYKDIVWLLENIISSFSQGMPLGNLTSQLFANIYLNKFDQYIKHGLKIKYYLRYADDFVLMHQDKEYLKNIIPEIKCFLHQELKLTLPNDKIVLKTLNSGLDFLGWVHFYDHRVLRTKTKKRMFRRLVNDHNGQSLYSYLGLLNHGQAYKIEKEALNQYWLNSNYLI